MKFTKKELETIRLALAMDLKECDKAYKNAVTEHLKHYWERQINDIIDVRVKIESYENRNL